MSIKKIWKKNLNAQLIFIMNYEEIMKKWVMRSLNKRNIKEKANLIFQEAAIIFPFWHEPTKMINWTSLNQLEKTYQVIIIKEKQQLPQTQKCNPFSLCTYEMEEPSFLEFLLHNTSYLLEGIQSAKSNKAFK